MHPAPFVRVTNKKRKAGLSMRRILSALTMLLLLAPLAARADVIGFAGEKLDKMGQALDSVWGMLSAPLKQEAAALPAPVEATPMVWIAPAPRKLQAAAMPEVRMAATDFASPSLPARAPARPSVEKAEKKLACVEYARALSGLNIFGDARYWWARAKNLYDRASTPVEEAVMVFTGTAKLKRGHVAVVSEIISPREIRVEQANWMNKGEIDHATPILDVSARNDWSKVRVWDVPSQQFGSVYAVSGFILKPLVRTAANN
jgi:hypothetical protein